jgi:hypothetical protein
MGAKKRTARNSKMSRTPSRKMSFETNHWAEEAWERARSRKEETRREKAASVAVSASAANNASKAMKSGGKGEMTIQSNLP